MNRILWVCKNEIDKMKQFDMDRITKDFPVEGITKGQIGTILEVWDENHFEVEISDSNGITLFLGVLSGDFIAVVV